MKNSTSHTKIVVFLLLCTANILHSAQAPEALAPIGELRFPRVNVTSFAFGKNGVLAVGFSMGEIELWDTYQGNKVKDVGRNSQFNVGHLAFSENGKMLASIGGNEIYLWNIPTNNLAIAKTTLQVANQPRGLRSRAVAFSPDEKILAVGFEGGIIWLWDIINNKMSDILQGNTPSGFLTHLSFSPNMKMLASGYANGTIRLWNSPQYHSFIDLIATSGLFSLAFSPNSRILAAGYEDGTIRLWDTKTQQFIEMRGHRSAVNALSFDSTGILASGSDDSTIRLWDITTNPQQPQQITAQQLDKPVELLEFSPDGSGVLASSATGRGIKLWQLRA